MRKKYCQQSHPVWVRGLKHYIQNVYAYCLLSHPVWVRGLKLKSGKEINEILKVAPRVGAWIETLVAADLYSMVGGVAPRVGAWIETLGLTIHLHHQNSRTPCGCVD